MLRKLSLSLFIFLFLIGIGWLFVRNNIHVVIKQQIYRSAQLSPGSLAYLIQKEHLKSVINLRGENSNQVWYQDEMTVAKQYGIAHYDIRMSAYQVASAINLQELVNLLETAPRPLLIHCQGGSDRTGLASALVLILDKNASLASVTKQYSLFYLVIHADSTAKLTLPYYEGWLAAKKRQNNKENLLAWVKQLPAEVNYPR